MTTINQLELGFNGTQSRIHGRRRETRVARARWWFAKMRAAVENAWQEQAPPRPEQIILAGMTREVNI
jgi:hypothetical protein